MRKRIAIIIPSRAQDAQLDFLRRLLKSIEAQSAIDNYMVTARIGVDAGRVPDFKYDGRLSVVFVESSGAGQATALNAAMRGVDDDYVGFLEDDDRWQTNYLSVAMTLLEAGKSGFVSSTQLEVDPQDKIVRINDFPTPSGWLMRRKTLETVGEFDASYKWHLDNDWLGRLNAASVPRAHLVEATAPINPRCIRPIRPWLANVLKNSNGNTRLVRHNSPFPLVVRLVHGGSGMSQIATDENARRQSREECERLMGRYKQIPW